MPEPTTLDHSRLEAYHLCPQRYDYAFNHQLAYTVGPAARFSVHLIHKPITRWHESGDTPTDNEYYDYWNACEFTDAELMAANKKKVLTITNAQLALSQYIEKFQSDRETYPQVTVEKYIESAGIRYGAKVDVLLSGPRQKKVVELKWSSFDAVSTAVSINRQLLGQAYVSGAKVAALRIIYCRKPGDVNVVEYEEIVSLERLERWRRDTIFKINAIKQSKQFNEWPREAPHSCMAYYKPCPFLELCCAPSAEEYSSLLSVWPKADNYAYLEE